MKPDWATRLQRTFARKYDAGFAKGLMFGKAVGARDEQERIIGIIERCPRIDDDYMIQCDARHLIGLIKGENK